MRNRPASTLALAVPAWFVVGSLALLVETGTARRAFAQQAAAPDPGTWTGTAGAGLALTSGNSDTLNFNLAFDATRDPKSRNVMKWTGLYLRGEQNDALVANSLSLSFRDQYDVAMVTAITAKF